MLFKWTIAQCDPIEVPFKSGEQLNYNAYYNLKKIWVPAGKVRFEVKDSLYEGKECFHLDGKGKTLKKYDYFFKVRDHYAAIVDKHALIPQRFVRKVNEGGFKLHFDYRFDESRDRATIYSHGNDTTIRSTFAFPKCTYDVITSVYLARSLDFSGMKIGETVPLKMMIDKTIYDDIYIRYTGTEKIKAEDGHIYDCIKFRPLLVEGTIFEEGEDMQVFITNDKNHIPVYIEAEILVGSVKAYLTSFRNNKYPVTSRGN